jgi:putative transposase
MGLAHSTYYYRSRQKSTQAKKEEADLRDRIEEIVVGFARYGYRRVTHQLRRQGWKVNHKRGGAADARAVATVSDQAAVGKNH